MQSITEGKGCQFFSHINVNLPLPMEEGWGEGIILILSIPSSVAPRQLLPKGEALT